MRVIARGKRPPFLPLARVLQLARGGALQRVDLLLQHFFYERHRMRGDFFRLVACDEHRERAPAPLCARDRNERVAQPLRYLATSRREVHGVEDEHRRSRVRDVDIKFVRYPRVSGKIDHAEFFGNHP